MLDMQGAWPSRGECSGSLSTPFCGLGLRETSTSTVASTVREGSPPRPGVDGTWRLVRPETTAPYGVSSDPNHPSVTYLRLWISNYTYILYLSSPG